VGGHRGLTISGFSLSYETVEAVTVTDDVLVSADATLNAREYYLASLVVSDNSVLRWPRMSRLQGSKGSGSQPALT
jgi:hypothetical protein